MDRETKAAAATNLYDAIVQLNGTTGFSLAAAAPDSLNDAVPCTHKCTWQRRNVTHHMHTVHGLQRIRQVGAYLCRGR